MTTGIPRGHPIVAFVLDRAREVSRVEAEKLEETAMCRGDQRADAARAMSKEA